MENTPLLTITASELARRAIAYGEAMVKALEEYNRQYPFPQGLTEKELETLKAVMEPLHPTPDETRLHFEELFCLSMANYFIIIPD